MTNGYYGGDYCKSTLWPWPFQLLTNGCYGDEGHSLM